MPLEVFPFRYRSERTGKWVRARYKATREDIAARYREWEVTGPAELREPCTGSFKPYRQGGGLNAEGEGSKIG